ncbi:MAG: 1-acyl-sn-glycerol-3-phosphate acyltransferase, partial [Deltaproteobacteria bacterium]|nr:1-acyl-sn-glycerol-3-phosphate acyltransferase [Deltaproteobacteria bacterium]
ALKTDFWGTGSLIKDFGPINHKNPIGIAFGKPMTINGSGKKEHEQITAFIQEQLGRWEKDRDQ